MAKFEEMKAEQVEEACAQLEELVWSRLDAVYQEIELLQKKASPLKPDEVTGALVAAFYSYSARLARETEQTKEEFVEEIEEMFDDLGEDDDDEVETASETETPPEPS